MKIKPSFGSTVLTNRFSINDCMHGNSFGIQKREEQTILKRKQKIEGYFVN